MSTAAPRTIKTDDSSSALEPHAPVARAPVLERGAVLTLSIKVLRIDGPWIQVSFAGDVIRVLRSQLVKELTPDGC